MEGSCRWNGGVVNGNENENENVHGGNAKV